MVATLGRLFLWIMSESLTVHLHQFYSSVFLNLISIFIVVKIAKSDTVSIYTIFNYFSNTTEYHARQF